jgi:putative redox protein
MEQCDDPVLAHLFQGMIMQNAEEIVFTLPGGCRVDARFGEHVLHAEQPGEVSCDSLISPFQLFLSSIGTCAGFLVHSFCISRGIDFTEIQILERMQNDAAGGLEAIELELQLPAEFPEKYRGAIARAVEQCSVTRAIQAHPVFRVVTSLRPDAEAEFRAARPSAGGNH